MSGEIEPEETVDSTTVYAGRVIKVRRDIVSVPIGATAVREVVEHGQVVAMVATDGDGRLLLVRQYRYAVGMVTIEIPAGGVDPGESPEDAVRREMREETGYIPGRIERLCSVYPTFGVSNEIMHIFNVTNLTGDGVPTEAVDQLRVLRVSRDEAVAMIRGGKIVDAKSIIGILWPLAS